MNQFDDFIVIICSRTDSSRVPGKVFRKINGISCIHHILKRIEDINLRKIIAVPDYDFKSFEYNLMNMPVEIYRSKGDLENKSPLHRMYSVLKSIEKRYKWVVRITHDDILIDPICLIDLMIQVEIGNFGYAISDGIIEGAGVEIISVENIEYAALKYDEPIEHISYFVKGKCVPNKEILHSEVRQSIKRPYRLTIDYMEDIVVLESIFREVGAFASNDDICKFLDNNKYILDYNKLPDLTIYTCAFNAEQFIHSCIMSIVQEDFNFEYIIVEDSSTDKTLSEILKTWNSTKKITGNDKIIVNEKNVGLASSSNEALSNARGKYIMRIDADDLLYAKEIPNVIEFAKSNHSGIVYPNFDILCTNGFIEKNVSNQNVHHVGGALIDKRLLNEIKFKEGLRNWDSFDLYHRMKDIAEVHYYDKPIFLYRRHHKAMSLNNLEQRQIEKEMIEKEHAQSD